MPELNEEVENIKAQWNLVCMYGSLLAEMPIEKWLTDLEHSESVVPFLDPTLFRDYIYSGKGEVIKDVLRGAIQFKQAILKARETVLTKGII